MRSHAQSTLRPALFAGAALLSLVLSHGGAEAQTSGAGTSGDAALLAGLDPVKLGDGDLLGDISLCPSIPPGGFPNVTNPRFYFLSEVGGCENLPCFLAQVEGTVHANATLVIDEVCTLHQSIRIPSRFTLAGVGPDGEGKLVFEDLPPNTAGISIKHTFPDPTNVVIRDLDIQGSGGGPWTGGINVSNSNVVAIQNTRVAGFSIGVFGRHAYSVNVQSSSIYANAFNVMIHEDANHWVIRDSTLSLGWIGVKIFGSDDGRGVWSNDHVITANRVEGNLIGALRLGSYGAMVMNNRFESNGYAGVTVTPQATGTRIVANMFSTDTVHDSAADTKCALNIGLAAGSCPGD